MMLRICRAGLFSSLFVLLWALTGLPASLDEEVGKKTSLISPVNFHPCPNMGISNRVDKSFLPHEPCRPITQDKNHSEVSLQLFHPDFIWGDRFYYAQLAIEDSSLCIPRNNPGVTDPKMNCNVMGMPGMNSASGVSVFPETIQSHYEFELPEKEFRRDTGQGWTFSAPGRKISWVGLTNFSDWYRINTEPNISPSTPLLTFHNEGFRSLVFWDADYQVEVTDTLTRFIPKGSVHTRSLEVGDFVVLFLLLFLLPDYRKIRSLVGHVWEPNGR